MKTLQNQFIQVAKITILGLILGFSISLASAWTGPTVVPPNCPAGAVGCDAPLHTGTNLQTKSGALWANFFGTTGGGYFGGNVGIGTQAPTAKLQVHGAFRLIKEGGPTPGVPFFGADGYYGTASGTTANEIGGSVSVDLRRARGTVAAPLPVKNGDRLGGLYFAGWDGGSFYGANGNAVGIQAFAREDFTSTKHGSSLQFETTPVGSETRAARMVITSQGNVGINDTDPTAKLDVTGNVHATQDICTDAGGGKCLSTAGGSVPNATRVVTATQTTWRWPAAAAACGSTEVVVGGGGVCQTDHNGDGTWGSTNDGFTFLNSSRPLNNGWYASCDTIEDTNGRVTVYAVCLKK